MAKSTTPTWQEEMMAAFNQLKEANSLAEACMQKEAEVRKLFIIIEQSLVKIMDKVHITELELYRFNKQELTPNAECAIRVVIHAKSKGRYPSGCLTMGRSTGQWVPAKYEGQVRDIHIDVFIILMQLLPTMISKFHTRVKETHSGIVDSLDLLKKLQEALD